MPEPVLVVHGVANRDRDGFESKVKSLNARVGDEWELLPVYWGDIAADADDDLFESLPVLNGDTDLHVRGGGEPDDAAWARWVQEGLGNSDTAVVRADPVERILEGVADRTVSGQTSVRSEGAPEWIAGEIRAAVASEMPQTRYLQYVNDPAVLEAIGRVLGDAVLPVANDGSSATATLVRSDVEAQVTRGVIDTVRRKTGDVLHDLDELLGRSVGEAAGRLNLMSRQGVGRRIVQFFGDVFVYSRNQAKIHARFWEAIEKYQGPDWLGPSWGTQERPINVIAHSLGGVAAFDAALDGQRPLWIRHFVTFGSQAAFFHTVDRREQLAEFTKGRPVSLPDTIGSWTNLWEPMDLLAFTAGIVFRLANDGQPSDIRVNSGLSELWDAKAWTHSAYWESDELLQAIRDAFGR